MFTMKLLKLITWILAFHSYDQALLYLNQPDYSQYVRKSQVVELLLDDYFKSQVSGLQYSVFYARKNNKDPIDKQGDVVIKGNKKAGHKNKKGTWEIGKNFVFSTPVESEIKKRIEHAEFNIIENIGIGNVDNGDKIYTEYYMYSFFSPCCTLSDKWWRRINTRVYQDTTDDKKVPYCAHFSCAVKTRNMIDLRKIPLTVAFSRVFGVQIPKQINTVFPDAEYKFYLSLITIISSGRAALVWMRENDDRDWFQLQLFLCLEKVKEIKNLFNKKVSYPLRKFVNILTWHCLKKQWSIDEMAMFHYFCLTKSFRDKKSGVRELLSPNRYISLENAVGECYSGIDMDGRKTLGPALNTGNEDVLIPSSLYNDYIGYYYEPKRINEFFEFENFEEEEE